MHDEHMEVEPLRNLCMTVAYDGTNYNGFQTQPIGSTVQDELEASILSLTGHKPKIIASGRTDAGVHAYAQVFNFHVASKIPAERWPLALNARLPQDIVVTRSWEVPLEFNSRHAAKRKTYRYTINANRHPDVFQRHMQFHHPAPRLDIGAMEEALQQLVGTHDFTSFASTQSQKADHVRTLLEARIEVDASTCRSGTVDQGFIHIFLTGTGFLQHMVRIITGTLIQVGEGKRKPEEMKAILQACDRAAAGPTAVGKGLALWNVDYGDLLPE